MTSPPSAILHALEPRQLFSTVPPAPAAVLSQSQPHGGIPFQLPGTLQLENYDKGGETIAFHDTDAVNQGAAYRTESADVQAIPATAGGGYALAFTRPGEWTRYTFDAAPDKAGHYDLILRYAAPLDGGTFRLELDGKAITAPTPAFGTGGWQTYMTLTFYDMNLTPGTHVLRLVQYKAGSYGYVANFDALEFRRYRLPLHGTPFNAGDTIPAVDYDYGSEGYVFHDTEPANLGGGTYRSGDGVDLERIPATPTAPYNYAVDYAKAGEWIEYTIAGPATPATYGVNIGLASLRAGGRFHVELERKPVASFIAPATGSWSTYGMLTSPKNVLVTPGMHVLRIVMDANGPTGYVANFDWLKLAAA